jgi:hypothetical protein
MPTDARKVIGYENITEKVLAQASITEAIAFTDLEGVPGYETVKMYVNELATVANYVPGTGVALSSDGSNYVDINTKKEKGINEILDGYTVVTAPSDLIAGRLDAAIRAFGEQVDTDFLVQLATDGTQAVLAAGAKPVVATIYDDILGLKLALDTAKAPKTNRSLIVTAEMENLLLSVDSKVILNTSRGDSIQTEGYVGRLLGFDIYSNEQLPAGTNMIAMQQRGGAFKFGWKREPLLQSLDGSGTFIGDSAVQGRLAYVYGVVRPTLVQVHKGAA